MSEEIPEGEEAKKPEGVIIPQGDVTVELAYPIEFGETTVTELTFRPLTAKDMRRSSANLQTLIDQSTILEYAGYLSGQPAHIIDRLMGPDAIEVVKAVSDFFVASRGTGPKQ